MIVNPDFILREFAGEWILVSIAENEENKRILYLNEIGKDIYTHLLEGLEGDSLLNALQEEYEADPQVLKQDVEEYMEILRSYRVIIRS